MATFYPVAILCYICDDHTYTYTYNIHPSVARKSIAYCTYCYYGVIAFNTVPLFEHNNIPERALSCAAPATFVEAFFFGGGGGGGRGEWGKVQQSDESGAGPFFRELSLLHQQYNNIIVL